MSNSEQTNTESPDIIEEIIPGKNDDYNNKSINQNNNNNQQPFIENYNEKESALAVIEEATEDSTKSIDRDTDKAQNQISLNTTAIIDAQEQTTQTTKEITENYLELQKYNIDSFQSIFIPYFQNVQNQFWSNQEFFQGISKMYYRWFNNYAENMLTFSKKWNNIAFTKAGYFNSEINKATR